MKERGILFSAPMVSALLSGSKTMTRRVCKVQPEPHHWESLFGYEFLSGCYFTVDGYWARFQHCIKGARAEEPLWVKSPYGNPGDRLWVRETWQAVLGADGRYCIYGADYNSEQYKNLKPWKPSIHQFREDSRITLEITGVRVERLNDISEEDAQAEGAKPSLVGADLEYLQYRAGFQSLWESINGEGSWNINPWVWVISFKRV